MEVDQNYGPFSERYSMVVYSQKLARNLVQHLLPAGAGGIAETRGLGVAEFLHSLPPVALPGREQGRLEAPRPELKARLKSGSRRIPGLDHRGPSTCVL